MAQQQQVKMNAKQATFDFLDWFNAGDCFSGHELSVFVTNITHETHYPATTLRYMREWRRARGRKVVCINKRRSMYEVM